jgi:amylosucrase
MTRLSGAYDSDQQFIQKTAEKQVGAFESSFAQRFSEHFPRLHSLFVSVYGEREDGLEALADVVALAAQSWN